MQLFIAMIEDEIRSIVGKIHRFLSSKVMYVLLLKKIFVCMLINAINKIGSSAPGAWKLSYAWQNLVTEKGIRSHLEID